MDEALDQLSVRRWRDVETAVLLFIGNLDVCTSWLTTGPRKHNHSAVGIRLGVRPPRGTAARIRVLCSDR
jgi:hypothetical protein